jgi:hypothetical protein
MNDEEYPYPVGSIKPDEFNEMPEGTIFYGVWRRTGEISKYSFNLERSLNKKGFSRRDLWCENTNERRAFLNYFHAHAYSLKIKDLRAQDLRRYLGDKQEGHKAFP